MARVKNGQKPIYSVSNLGAVSPQQDGQGELSISLPVNDGQNSLFTLELNADAIRFVTNKSPAKIVNANAAPFEAMSGDGQMSVQVQNIGTLVADYTITVQNCSRGIAPVQAQARSIQPGEVLALTFGLRSTDQAATKRTCNVVIYGAGGEAIDARLINFSTFAAADNRANQDGANDGKALHNTTGAGGSGLRLSLPLCSCALLLPFPDFSHLICQKRKG
eukprot:jgi/Mesen1/8180/ME000044S07450